MSIQPLILGSGHAGQAIATSFAKLALLYPELEIRDALWLKRGVSFAAEKAKYENPLLCIANPHGLHAEAILEGERAGFPAILCEKPVCVNLEQVAKLRGVKTPTAVLHGYRQTWGMQTIKKMIEAGDFGALISVEGRYWQSSVADAALACGGKYDPSVKKWKNDPNLSGEFDSFLDIGTHWVDAASFLYGSTPTKITGWRSYVNSEAAHRDTHLQLAMDFAKGGRGFTSVSKTVHGATNHFEIRVLGEKKTAAWEFLNPDEILIGEGRSRRVIVRKEMDMGSKQWPYHGMGWLEGYIEVAHGLLGTFSGRSGGYPTLRENLDVLEAMFKTEWTSR
jgi:predicted dehydrogenase